VLPDESGQATKAPGTHQGHDVGPRREGRRTSARLPTETFKRPRCPKCKGVKLLKFRSCADMGDGASLSWVACGNEECGYRFRMVME
jgi:hypothetical protein